MQRVSIMLIICFLLAGAIFSVAEEGDIVFSEDKAMSFNSIPLLNGVHSTWIKKESVVSDTGSFAMANDFYAYSCCGLSIRDQGKSEFSAFGETIFTDKQGKVLSRFGKCGILQGLGNKVIIRTTDDNHYVFCKKTMFEPKEIIFRDSKKFKVYLTRDDATLFCFSDYKILAESISIDSDGFAILKGRKITRRISRNRITRYGFALVRDGVLHSSRWSNSTEDPTIIETETEEPIRALKKEYSRFASSSTKILEYQIEAYITKDSTVLLYSKRNTVVLVSRVGTEWITKGFCETPARTEGLTAETVPHINSENSEIILPFKRDLVILSHDFLHQYRCKGMGKMAYYRSSFEMRDGSFHFLSKFSSLYTADSNGISYKDCNLGLAFSDVVLSKNGIIRVTSDIDKTHITIQKYPEFSVKSIELIGNVFQVSNEDNGNVLLIVDNQQIESIYKLCFDTCLIEKVKHLPAERKIAEIFVSSNQFVYTCVMKRSEIEQRVFVQEFSSKEDAFSVKLCESDRCPYRLKILNASGESVIVQSVFVGYAPMKIYIYTKKIGVKELKVTRDKWIKTDKKGFYSKYYSCAYIFEEGENEITMFSIIDDPVFRPMYGGCMYVDGINHFFSSFFRKDASLSQYCVLINDDGDRQFWKLDRKAGYVYSPSANPEKLYSPSIVRGKIIEFTRDM